ncbi:two-component system response regulator YesN [Clostridium saccharoperbutylacetonicum]|uniref:Stage 0 sporulation protein A homolog n=1 Tax=Clostridium saccharoperbutylacetonicum N1-4(HMT) TaxID=931276 RepID=M1LMQ6_9CLOT|nr:response regulator [Clostridium saccharoperbutylacetonicum]AGF54090.1 response regulator receiver protein [Clostridium saccharoperbutylacetonicum N1-4(HMT)]NRT59397.1 two-component system response regulator YesN [Clostridium saccharoperbutylacetonicum]NSB28588.1 two-component system response regulator YesN [Clostridium saccharoperbutylacetonicum]NSB42080.1 two-component system response regulator YesN [Clostridium saccharoperbutylacetonicum]
MLNVLIIDDEPNVRLGLRKIISWEENGFKVCGEGQDAEDGYDKIINLKPDIVLIDIKLPGKLGTDVIKETIEAGFTGKFIIISGYSNFEYAKTGIKYGVKSYILKPVDEDELMDILLKLKKEIETEKRWALKKTVVHYANLQEMILDEKYNFDKEDELNSSYYNYDRFQVVLMLNQRNKKNNLFNLEEFVKTQLENHGDVDIVKFEDLILILFKGFKEERVFKTLDAVKSKLDQEVENPIFITIGTPVNKINKIRSAYNEAKELMEKRFIFLEKGIISKDNIELNFNNIKVDLNEVVFKIYSFVEVNDLEQIEIEFRNIEAAIIKEGYLEEEIKAYSTRIFIELKEKLINDYDSSEIKIINNEEIIKNIYNQLSLKSTIDYLIKNFTDISNQIGTNSSDNIIKRVTGYINRNYYKDIKLESLAEIFNYNSAYLGKLFKSIEGESFNTYLDKIRIEKAKLLLVDDNLKVYQVCEKIGYKNIDYFHSKFKKYVGTSPLSYKKQFDKEE